MHLDAAVASMHAKLKLPENHGYSAMDYLQSWEFSAFCLAARRYKEADDE